MPKQPNADLFTVSLLSALCAATFGSFKFAQASIKAHTTPTAVLTLPRELGGWKSFESASDVTSADVVARRYINKDNVWVGVVVRSTPANAVLHDLSSCLINADSKPKVERTENLTSQSGALSASLMSLRYKGTDRLALLWFQQGAFTAADRWGWRILSTTNPKVRDANVYYQVETIIQKSGNVSKDIAALRDVACRMFEEVSRR